MHFKDEIVKAVYNMYINGAGLNFIANETELGLDDVDEIIDYMNELFN